MHVFQICRDLLPRQLLGALHPVDDLEHTSDGVRLSINPRPRELAVSLVVVERFHPVAKVLPIGRGVDHVFMLRKFGDREILEPFLEDGGVMVSDHKDEEVLGVVYASRLFSDLPVD